MIRSRLVALLLAVCCLGAARGSVDALVDALVDRLPEGGGADVGVALRAPAPRLATDLGELLMGRLRGRGYRPVRVDGVAGAQARGLAQVIDVQLDAAGGRLRANGTVWAVPSRLWAGGQPAEARAHLFADVALDDELRALLQAPMPQVPAAWQVASVPLGDVALLAIDVGDLDGDLRSELVGATANEVIVWRIDGGRAVEKARWPLAGRPAPVRPRTEVVTVSVEGGAVRAHAAAFADGVRRSAGVAQPVRGHAFPGVEATCDLVPGFDVFAGDACAPGRLPDRFWSAAGLRRPGEPLTAAVSPPGVLWVRPGTALPLTVRGAGAQVALAALERGELVATSEAVIGGEPDAIVVRALQPGLPVVHRVDRLPGQVRALAAGDLDGDGRSELVAAVRDDGARRTELWVLR